MSIALNARIKELAASIEAIERRQETEIDRILREFNEACDRRQKAFDERLTAIENRPKPGRPPKNG